MPESVLGSRSAQDLQAGSACGIASDVAVLLSVLGELLCLHGVQLDEELFKLQRRDKHSRDRGTSHAVPDGGDL